MEATFLFVDMAGFTALTEAHGDETAADLVARFHAVVDGATGEEATIVDSVGDGAFLAASAPRAGLRVAARLWAAVDDEAAFPAVRAGLHHGETVRRGSRFFGKSVNLAARVAAQARGDELLATASIVDAAAAEGFPVTSLGPVRLRNVTEPVELFSIGIRRRDASIVVDPVCRMTVEMQKAAGHLRVAGRTYWFCSLECAGRFARDPSAYVSRGAPEGSGGR